LLWFSPVKVHASNVPLPFLQVRKFKRIPVLPILKMKL